MSGGGIVEEKINGANLLMFCLALSSIFLFFVSADLFMFYYAFFNWNGIDPTYQYVGMEEFYQAIHDDQIHSRP